MSSLAGSRILFLFPTLELGGAERQGLLLARYLQVNEEADIEIWGLAGGKQLTEVCNQLGIKTHIVRFEMWTSRLNLAKQLFLFAKEVRDRRFDFILPYVAQPNLVACAVWRWTGAKACIWQQRDEGLARGPRRLEKRALKSASCFISNSRGGAEFLHLTLGVEEDRIHYVPNGVESGVVSVDRSNIRRELGIDESTLVVTMVANLTTAKDHATLLRAWRSVINRSKSPCLLLLAGRLDDASDKAKAVAFDLNLGKSVVFLGAVKDVRGIFAASDLCVYSSLREGCPNGLLEGMAAGLPVAATDIRGIRSAVGRGGFEFLSPPADHEGLAENILRFLKSPELRKSVGQVNRDRIAAEFSVENMCTSTVEIIHSAASA